MFSQPFATATGLFRGLESKRIDDHQKYRLGVRSISRSTRNEWIVSPAKTVKPIRGKINLRDKRMVIQRPSVPPKLRTRENGLRGTGPGSQIHSNSLILCASVLSSSCTLPSPLP